MLSFVKKYWIYTLVILIIFIIMLIILGGLVSKKNQPGVSPTPFPVPSDASKDYSNLNKLIPGKSTREDVEKINGSPTNVSVFGDRTYLYYRTPLNRFLNTVLIINNKVVYSYENVFGVYRGTLSNFINSYGQAPLKMYTRDEPYTWSIYPDKGIGVESDGSGDILVVIYFVPTTKESFIKNLAPELKLLTEQPPVSE